MSKNSSVSISTKSWHYIWMKFVLGTKLTPTPNTMKNLCPYFWLLIFSLFASPFVLPVKAIMSIVRYINTGITNFMMNAWIIPAAEKWQLGIQDLEAISILKYESKVSFWYKKAYNYDRVLLVQEWWAEKYNAKVKDDKGSYTAEYKAWHKEWQDKLDDILDVDETAKIDKREKKQAKKRAFENTMSSFRDRFESRWEKITDYFQSLNNIIRWTKRFMGIVITVIGLAITYVVTGFIAKAFLYIAEAWTMTTTINGGLGLMVLAVAVSVFILMVKWAEVIKVKGLELWYVKLIYYPLFYCIFWPLKIIFQYLIFEMILLNLFYLIIGSAKSLWRGILSFTGIFGEYFGASYSDVCPGLDWEENKEE